MVRRLGWLGAVALLGAALLIPGTAAAAGPKNALHQTPPISWDSANFQGGSDCDGLKLASGEVLWHFVHTGTGASDLPSTLTATFDIAGPQTAAGFQNGNSIVQYNVITGADTLLSASDSISNDGLLNLSHICSNIAQTTSTSSSSSSSSSQQTTTSTSETGSVSDTTSSQQTTTTTSESGSVSDTTSSQQTTTSTSETGSVSDTTSSQDTTTTTSESGSVSDTTSSQDTTTTTSETGSVSDTTSTQNTTTKTTTSETGAVSGLTGTPGVTPPSTASATVGSSGKSDGWRLILLALAGIAVLSLILLPSERKSRQR